jgi:hypothetical protein
MTKRLQEIFQTEGKLEIVGGNRPFLLDDPNSVWFILQGHIEVFSVRIENQLPVGTRFHFCSAQAGELLFGMDLAAYGMGRGFLAVGMVNTRLFRLPIMRFQEAVALESSAFGAAECLDKWVQ